MCTKNDTMAFQISQVKFQQRAFKNNREDFGLVITLQGIKANRGYSQIE